MAVMVFIAAFFAVYGIISLIYPSPVLIGAALIAASFLTMEYLSVFSSAEHAYQLKVKHDERVLRMKEGFVRIRVFLIVIPVGILFSFSLSAWAVILILSGFFSKYDVADWKSRQNNLMITLSSPDGSFQVAWVSHSPGDDVWCISFDKADKGLAIKKVTLKDNKEGFIQVEYGTKKATLFVWDGNADSPAKDKVQFFYHNPGHGIPRDAEVLTDVAFK